MTGKFVLEVREDDDKNRYVSVVVGLAPGVTGSQDKECAIAAAILAQFIRLNSELANDVPPDDRMPKVQLAIAADPEYFPLGVK